MSKEVPKRYFVMNDAVRNIKTKEWGLVVKHCKKTVKVLCEHPKIKGAHCFKYWREIESC